LLQLHQSRRCGSSHSTTGSCRRSFIGCRPLWKNPSTNSRRVQGGERRRHRRGCMPKHNHVFDLASTNIVTTCLNCHLFQHRTKFITLLHSKDVVGSSQPQDVPLATQPASPRPHQRQQRDPAIDGGNIKVEKRPRKKKSSYTPNN
jgi:hypothetical protein